MTKAPTECALTTGELPLSIVPSRHQLTSNSISEPANKDQIDVTKRPALAVLPFRSIDRDPGSIAVTLADGLSMEIMTALVKLSGLFLASDFSTLTYRDKSPNLTHVGSELGVNHVLDGTVAFSDDRVRVHTRLTDVVNGTQVWGERYDETLDDIFAVQDAITAAVVTALDIQLVMGESARVYRQSLAGPEALHRYYQGWSYLVSGAGHNLGLAQRSFEDAIALDPESPLPQAMAAWSYWWGAFQAMTDDPEYAFVRAESLATEAMKKGDPSGFSALVMAHMHLVNGRHDAALEAAQDALNKRPNCDASFAAIANILIYLDRADDAIPYARQAIRLTPLVPTIYPSILAKAYYANGQFPEAIRAANTLLQLNSDLVDAWIILAASFGATHHNAAADVVAQIRHHKPGFSLNHYCNTQPYIAQEPLSQFRAHLSAAGL